VILLLSTSDTDLFNALISGADYRCANPSRIEVADLPAMLVEVDLVVVRLLGGRAAWPEGLALVLGSGVPTVVLGGGSSPDAELMAASTVPVSIAQESLTYLVEGGSQNLGQLAAFLFDRVLGTGEGFVAPVPMPAVGVRSGASLPAPDGRPRVGVIYYRAHELSGDTGFIDDVVSELETAGTQPVPVFCASLLGLDRRDHPVLKLLDGCDALVVVGTWPDFGSS
jgi:cobaltochelatase CobN